MKTVRFTFLATTLLFISMPVVSGAFAEPANSLTWHWTAVDPIDGDTVHMTLGGGNDGVYQSSTFDIHAPLVCVESSGFGLLKGIASCDESTGIITKTVIASCPSEGIIDPENTLTLPYDSVTDTIYDSTFDLLYTR